MDYFAGLDASVKETSASGHAAAAPPRRAMNSRRFIFALIRSPRRRARAEAALSDRGGFLF
jgi:hypothetical protein